MLRFARVAVLSGAALLATSPSWAAANLLTNGSFESYNSSTTTFTGWTTSGNAGQNPSQMPVQQPTNGSTAGQYGDVVAPDPYTVSSDAAGSNAVFFVADNATQTLSQTITLVVGKLYEVGFDLFKTNSGSNNAGPFTITGQIVSNGVTTDVTTASSTSLAAGVWTHYAAKFIASTTSATFALNYVSGNSPAADVLADLAYVTAVPEPATIAMFGVGLLGLFAMRRRFNA